MLLVNKEVRFSSIVTNVCTDVEDRFCTSGMILAAQKAYSVVIDTE